MAVTPRGNTGRMVCHDNPGTGWRFREGACAGEECRFANRAYMRDRYDAAVGGERVDGRRVTDRRFTGRTHGRRATYRNGCRCDACRQAERSYRRGHRAAARD